MDCRDMNSTNTHNIYLPTLLPLYIYLASAFPKRLLKVHMGLKWRFVALVKNTQSSPLESCSGNSHDTVLLVLHECHSTISSTQRGNGRSEVLDIKCCKSKVSCLFASIHWFLGHVCWSLSWTYGEKEYNHVWGPQIFWFSVTASSGAEHPSFQSADDDDTSFCSIFMIQALVCKDSKPNKSILVFVFMVSIRY